MKYFDALKNEIIDDVPKWFAIDSVENIIYDFEKLTSIKPDDLEFGITFFFGPNEPIKRRNNFHSKSEMDAFFEAAQQLLKEQLAYQREKNKKRSP